MGIEFQVKGSNVIWDLNVIAAQFSCIKKRVQNIWARSRLSGKSRKEHSGMVVRSRRQFVKADV